MRIIFNWLFLVNFFVTPALAGVFYDDGATTMHFAFEGSPNDDRPIVRAPAFYHADDGFGFVDSPLLTGNRLGVSAPKYFRFDVNLPEGNYDVAVTLGNPGKSSITTVKAEGHRPMVLDARVVAGGSDVKTFTVNVQHGKLGDNEPLDSDGRLNLEFVGVNPSMMKLDIQPNPKAVTVYLAGDLWACDQDVIPSAGWGQMLPMLFKPNDVAISNQSCSVDGNAEANCLKSIAGTIKAGDYLLVQFGMNAIFDRPDERLIGRKFLQTYIDTARGHGATAILVTPFPARASHGDGTITNVKTADAQWMRELAAEQKLPLVDIEAASFAFLQGLEPEKRARLYADNGHFSAYGAYEMAKLVAQGIKDQKLDLASHLTGNLDTNPDPAKFPAHLGYDFLAKK